VWPLRVASSPIALVSVSRNAAEVDTHEVTHSDVLLILRQGDLGAEVTQVDSTDIVVERANIDSVFPGQPWVTRRLKLRQHFAVELPSWHFLNARSLPASAIVTYSL
jgi:hypothetical protein